MTECYSFIVRLARAPMPFELIFGVVTARYGDLTW